jgi:hypothetical protein
MIRERSLTELRGTSRAIIDELADSAGRLLAAIDRLKQAEENSEAYDKAEIAVEVLATEVRLDAASVEDSLEAVTEALPDDDD